MPDRHLEAVHNTECMCRVCTFLILDLSLHIFYRIAGLHLTRFQLIITDSSMTVLTSRVMVLPVRVFTKICIYRNKDQLISLISIHKT